jgi:hypothetical protein
MNYGISAQESAMEIWRLKSIFRFPIRSDFDLFLFVVGLILFSWPLLTVAAGADVEHLFLYLFLVWAGTIVLLYATARTILGKLPEKESD